MRSIANVLESEGIDLTGWQLLSATDVVNGEGAVIVSGSALNPFQLEEGWIVTIPEPDTLVASSAALLAVLLVARVSHSRRDRI